MVQAVEIPNPKHQIPNKLQNPTSQAAGIDGVEFAGWSLSGAWLLGFGAFSALTPSEFSVFIRDSE